jgi:hypothetical protein
LGVRARRDLLPRVRCLSTWPSLLTPKHDPYPVVSGDATESPPPAVSLDQRRRAADLALIAAGASHRVALDAAAADATAAAAAASTLSHPSRSPPGARSSTAVVASTSTLPALPLPPVSCHPAHAVRCHNTAAGAPADLLTEAAGAPLVLRGAAGSWPAVQRWADPAYLCTVAGPHVVPVELGSTYLADGESTAGSPKSGRRLAGRLEVLPGRLVCRSHMHPPPLLLLSEGLNLRGFRTR